MSEPLDATPAPITPQQSSPRPPRRPPSGGGGSSFLGCFLVMSVLTNFLLLGVSFLICLGAGSMATGLSDSPGSAPETYHCGTKTASDKVAIVSVDGPLFEGLMGSAIKQIDTAARDDKVKAVVLRINSPGGTITASEDLHQKLTALRDGDDAKGYKAKPLVVSMGSIAASGGYYLAVPGKKLFAEKTTMTGSIGVYISLPSAVGLSKQIGFDMVTIKAGEIKTAGSTFREMTPKERQVIQDMVDESYVQFLEVIEKDRPKLTRKVMLERFNVQPLQPDPQEGKKGEPYTRYRADGGTFNGPKAKELGLVDEVGTLDDAVKAAAGLANLTSYRAVKYSRTRGITDLLLGHSPLPAASLLDLERLEAGLTPRMWYLAPGHEAAAFAAAARAAK